MPVLSDFTDILEHIHTDHSGRDDHVVRLGDLGSRREDLSIAFPTGGRRRDSQAVLFCVYRGLEQREAEIQINGQTVGFLPPLPATRRQEWTTNMFSFRGEILRSTDHNSIHVEPPVLNDPEPGNIWDDFQFRELVCFFHQSA